MTENRSSLDRSIYQLLEKELELRCLVLLVAKRTAALRESKAIRTKPHRLAHTADRR